MEDLDLISVVEGIRKHLADRSPEVQRRLEAAAAIDYRRMSVDRLQQILVRIVHGIDFEYASGVRGHAGLMHFYRFGGDESAIEEGPDAPNSDSLQPRRDCLLAFRALEGSGSTPATPGDSSDQASGLSAAVVTPQLVAGLIKCANIDQAVRLVVQTLPVLKGMKTYQFLGEIGYPAPIPFRESQRFLVYLGILKTAGDSPEHRRSFFVNMERAARLSGLSIAQVDFLFRLHCGVEKMTGIEALCRRKPACSRCPIMLHCSYGRIRGEEPAAPSNPINQWAHDERPRERLLAGERLTNAELIGIILRTGTGRHSAVELGRQLMKEFKTLHSLEKASPMDIVTRMKGLGIGPAKAAEIKAAIELGTRVVRPAADERDGYHQVVGSKTIFDLYRPRYKAATQEEFLLVILNIKNKIQREVSVSVGTLNRSLVHPRDVFHHALREAAAGVIFVHNHPSGDPTPSHEDNELTKRLCEGGKILGIDVVDHVIIGAQNFYSYRDAGRLGR